MKFSCEKALLSAAVATTSRAVAVKSSIPAMEGILIEADTRLRLTGYNLETGIRTIVPADIREEGTLVLGARLFGEIVRKLPDDIAEREVIVLDPMLATGGSAVDAITQIKKRGAKSIKFIGIIAAPEGMQRLQEAHSDVDIYVAAMDEKLNENGYIVPGLGDAGDRIFGTK